MNDNNQNQANQSPAPQAGNQPPISPQDALRYNKEALLAEIERRKKNIEIFKAEIAKDEAEIARLQQIVAMIEAQGK